MDSKKIVCIALFLAIVFLISSEVPAARELAETFDNPYCGGDCCYGCCSDIIDEGSICHCCTYPGEKPNTEPPTKLHN